jgi:hypothetical protein
VGRELELASQDLLIDAKWVIIKIWWVTIKDMDSKKRFSLGLYLSEA